MYILTFKIKIIIIIIIKKKIEIFIKIRTPPHVIQFLMLEVTKQYSHIFYRLIFFYRLKITIIGKHLSTFSSVQFSLNLV